MADSFKKNTKSIFFLSALALVDNPQERKTSSNEKDKFKTLIHKHKR